MYPVNVLSNIQFKNKSNKHDKIINEIFIFHELPWCTIHVIIHDLHTCIL